MKKFLFLSSLILFALPAFASVHYTRTPSGTEITSPVKINLSFSDFVEDFNWYTGTAPPYSADTATYYKFDVYNSDDYFSACIPVSETSTEQNINVPIGKEIFGIDIASFVSLEDCNNTNSQTWFPLERWIDETPIFTIVAGTVQEQPPVPPSPAPSSGGMPAYRPEITLTSPKKGGVFSSEMSIEYQATDENDEHEGLEKEMLGLGPTPVSLFYSDKNYGPHYGIIPESDKILIAKDLAASGSYFWKIPDSIKEGVPYRIIADVVDKGGELDENVSELFTIDRTLPVFTIISEPAVTKGEDVKITVKSSKELIASPELSVAQRGKQAISVPLAGEKDLFEGVYHVISGYDGPAIIKISGKDTAGNTGITIISGRTFSVGIEPPPKPIIDFPLQEKVITKENTIFIKGRAREDTEVILIQNGDKEFKTKLLEDGTFSFDNLVLDPQYLKGENSFSIISRDAAENESRAAVLRIKFNFSPEVWISFPQENTVLSATSTIKIETSDKNNDPLLYTYEIKSLTGAKWLLIVSSTPDKRYVWDTRDFSDGQYTLKVTANDGFENVETVSPIFTIKNFLPVISFGDGDLTITNKSTVIISGRISTPESPNGLFRLNRFEYLMSGAKKWKPVLPDDGAFDSANETFTLALDGMEEGEYSLAFRARDSRGLYGRAVKDIIVDFGPPPKPVVSSPKPLTLITDKDDEDSGLAGVQFMVSGTAEPKSEINAVLKGETFKTITPDNGLFAVKITLKQHNQNDVVVFAVDHAGNKSPGTDVPVIYNNPPVIKFINPRPNRGLHGEAIVKWEIKDLDNDSITGVVLSYRKGSGSFVVLAKSPSENSFSWDVSNFEEASDYQLKLEATDGITPTSAVINFSVDNTPPVIEAMPFAQNAFKKAFTLVSKGTASDNFSGIEFIEYSIDGKNWYKAIIVEGYLKKTVSYKIRHPFELEDGEYDFGVRAVDSAGNISQPKFEKIIVDTTPPRIGSYTVSRGPLIFLPEGGSFQVIAGGKIKFTISLEEDTDKAFLTAGEQKINLLKDKATGLWEAEINLQTLGKSSISIAVADLLGNSTANKNIGLFNTIPRGKISFVDENNASQPIAEAKINIFVWSEENQAFVRWQSENYGENNPAVSFENSEYELALPSGKYQLLIQKTGFTRLRTNDFTLSESAFINFDFILTKRRGIKGFLEDILEKLNF